MLEVLKSTWKLICQGYSDGVSVLLKHEMALLVLSRRQNQCEDLLDDMVSIVGTRNITEGTLTQARLWRPESHLKVRRHAVDGIAAPSSCCWGSVRRIQLHVLGVGELVLPFQRLEGQEVCLRIDNRPKESGAPARRAGSRATWSSCRTGTWFRIAFLR